MEDAGGELEWEETSDGWFALGMNIGKGLVTEVPLAGGVVDDAGDGMTLEVFSGGLPFRSPEEDDDDDAEALFKCPLKTVLWKWGWWSPGCGITADR